MVSVSSKALICRHVRDCFLKGDDSGTCELILNGTFDLHDDEIQDICDEKFHLPISNTDDEDFTRRSPECQFVDLTEQFFIDSTELAVEPDLSKQVIARYLNNHNDAAFGDTSLTPFVVSSPLLQSSPTEENASVPLKSSKDPIAQHTEGTKVQSCLALALEQAKADGRLARSNLFADFAVFDARAENSYSAAISSQPGQRLSGRDRSSTFSVQIWNLIKFPRVSVTVQPQRDTTVRQFVGLVLWQFFNEVTEFQPNANPLDDLSRLNNSLVDRIVVYPRDTSDWDDMETELPPLEPSDPIHKYQFDSFALVEQPPGFVTTGPLPTTCLLSEEQQSKLVMVTIHLAPGHSRRQYPLSTPLSKVLQDTIQRRKLVQHGAYQYRLEAFTSSRNQSGTGQQSLVSHRTPLDMENMRLSDVCAASLPLNFVLVRENSRFEAKMPEALDGEDWCDIRTDVDFLEAVPRAKDERSYTPGLSITEARRQLVNLQLRQYNVTFLKGLNPHDVQLNVSQTGIRIDPPTTRRRPKLFSKSVKPMHLELNCLAYCEIIQNSSAENARPGTAAQSAVDKGKVQFRIIYVLDADSGWETKGSTPGSCGESRSSCVLPLSTQIAFQQLCFETQWTRAQAICDHLTGILEHCSSKARAAYLRLGQPSMLP